MSSTALAVVSCATPAVKSEQDPCCKTGLDGVGGGRQHAIVGGQSDDVDLVHAALPQPVGQRRAGVVDGFERAVGGGVVALHEHRFDGAVVELRVKIDTRVPTSQCRGHDTR